ncbi:MAG: ABC transporter permease [Paracoccaceae bacterium]
MLEPLITALVLCIVLSWIVGIPPLGHSVPLFVASGVLSCFVFQAVSLSVARTELFFGRLLEFPPVSLLDGILARFLLNALLAVGTGTTLIVVLKLRQDGPAGLDPGLIAAALGCAALLGFGFGVLILALAQRVPNFLPVWSIVARLPVFVSGALFLPELLPHGMVSWNALGHMTAVVRTGLYPLYDPALSNLWFSLVVALIPGVAGLAVLHRTRG